MTNIQKIRQEIERLKKCSESAKKEWIDEGYNQNAFAEDCRIKSFDKLLVFIDSLPDENNPEPYNPVYDEDYLNEKIAKATKSWEGVDVDAMLAECRGYEEKPSEDLEEAAENYIAPIENDKGLDYINFNGRDIKDAFIAGWNGGIKSQEKKIADAYEKGKQEGIREVRSWESNPGQCGY